MATQILTDAEINTLLTEKKKLPENWKSRLKLRPKSGTKFEQRDLEVVGEMGSRFWIVIRKSILNPFDFSIILRFVDPAGVSYRLTRFNGKHPSDHTNRLEFKQSPRRGPNRFCNVAHIHLATERYQQAGYEIDEFAKTTRMYGTCESALDRFVEQNGFFMEQKKSDQSELFS